MQDKNPPKRIEVKRNGLTLFRVNYKYYQLDNVDKLTYLKNFELWVKLELDKLKH